MSKEVMAIKKIDENKLILPEQPNHDDFLQVMDNLFQYSCWFGIMGSKNIIWRVWSLILLCLLIVVEINAIWKVIKALAGWAVDTVGHRSVTARFGGTFFYTISIFSLIFCSRFCILWRNLSAHWAFVEKSMALKIPADRFLKKKLVFVICFMTAFSYFEHVMSILSLVGLDCPPELILKRYTLLSHGFMILRHEYAEWMAFPILVLSILATALWNYQDLLIMLISMGLTSRYHRLNRCVEKICSKYKEIKSDKKQEALMLYTWRKIREAYVKQAHLVRKMDSALGAIVVMSAFCNFYFICLQLFLAITQGKYISNLRRLYFVTSLAWLIIRISGVVLTASDVNVSSKAALKYIYNCDEHRYNVEMERLQNQLSKDFVALSGMGFFTLNRVILLQMAGAIITYELVLIQLDDGAFTDMAAIVTGNVTVPQ